MPCVPSCRRLRAFRSLAGNRALVRVVAAYALFILTEYSVWVAMPVFAYSQRMPAQDQVSRPRRITGWRPNPPRGRSRRVGKMSVWAK